MKNSIRERKIDILFWVVISFVYFLRIVFLDADAHSYILNEIQPIDEGYYNEIALKISEIGFFNVIGNGVGSVTIPNAKCFLVSNILSGISLSILGKTYFALRFPNVVLGYLGLIFLSKILSVCKVDSKLKYLGLAFYVFDFNLLTLTRSAVTIVPCMFVAILYVYVYLKNKSNYFWKVFWGAFISIFSFCSIYMGLSFFLLASFLMACILGVRNLKNKNVISKVISGYILGNLIGLVASELLAKAFLNEHILNVVLNTFAGFGAKIAESLTPTSQLLHWARTGTQFWTAYMFRYNYILLLFFVVAVLCWWKKKKTEEYYLLLTFVFSHWLQTIVLENATASKATISYGIIVIFVIYTWNYFGGWKLSGVQKGTTILFTGIVWIFGAIFYSSYFSPKGMLFFCICNLFIVVVYLFGIKIAKCNYKRIIILLVLGINICLSLKIVYANPTYDDKDICIELKELVGDKTVIGGFPLPFSLYNNIVVGVNAYNRYTLHGMDFEYVNSLYEREVEKHDELYFLGYASGNNAGAATINEINDVILKDTGYYFEEIKHFKRHYYSRSMNDSDMILYKRVERK